MAKTYLVTCQYKGKDFKDFYTTVVYPPETFDEEGEPVEPEDKFGKELAEDIIEVATAHVLANAKHPILPYSDVAIMKVVEMTEEPEVVDPEVPEEPEE